MADDLIPGMKPKEGGDKASPDEKAGNERPQDSQKNLGSEHRDTLAESKTRLIVSGILFLIIEAAAFVLWQIADGLTGYICVFVHWISLICISTGPLPAARDAIKREKRWWLWFAFVIVWLLLAGVAYKIWRPLPPEPKPHLVLSLQIGDSPDSKVFLTNDFLFARRIVKVGDLPDGAAMLNSFVRGCLVIPVQEGQSNEIFSFSAENRSAVKITDLEAAVGFPKEWKCGLDSAKWHEVGGYLIISEAWKFAPTNMQYFVAQSPWVLFPFDTLEFPPITNRCIPEYIGDTFKGGLVELYIRSTGFENVLAANIVFIPASPIFSKPFLIQGSFDAEGHLDIPFPFSN